MPSGSELCARGAISCLGEHVCHLLSDSSCHSQTRELVHLHTIEAKGQCFPDNMHVLHKSVSVSCCYVHAQCQGRSSAACKTHKLLFTYCLSPYLAGSSCRTRNKIVAMLEHTFSCQL